MVKQQAGDGHQDDEIPWSPFQFANKKSKSEVKVTYTIFTFLLQMLISLNLLDSMPAFKISCQPSNSTAIYLIAMPTLSLLNSQSQQNAADALPLKHLLPKILHLLQTLLKTLSIPMQIVKLQTAILYASHA